MCEVLVGCLGKIAQEAIGAAMESVTRDGSTRLGRRRAIALKKRGPFSNFRHCVPVCWVTQSESISVDLLVSECLKTNQNNSGGWPL